MNTNDETRVHNARLGVNSILSQLDEIDKPIDPPYYPVMDHILVEPLKQPTKSAGGIDLPDMTRMKAQAARIIRWGHLVHDMLPGIENEKSLLYSKYVGNDLAFENNHYIILRAKDVLAFEREVK